jgi:hypothetical protein
MANSSASTRFLIWAIALSALFELITIGARLGTGISASEFNASDPPLLLQIHHAFWSLPFLLALPIVWRWERLRMPVAAIAIALILSDALHHLIVLPLWVGNTGWHWP